MPSGSADSTYRALFERKRRGDMSYLLEPSVMIPEDGCIDPRRLTKSKNSGAGCIDPQLAHLHNDGSPWDKCQPTLFNDNGVDVFSNSQLTFLDDDNTPSPYTSAGSANFQDNLSNASEDRKAVKKATNQSGSCQTEGFANTSFCMDTCMGTCMGAQHSIGLPVEAGHLGVCPIDVPYHSPFAATNDRPVDFEHRHRPNNSIVVHIVDEGIVASRDGSGHVKYEGLGCCALGCQFGHHAPKSIRKDKLTQHMWNVHRSLDSRFRCVNPECPHESLSLQELILHMDEVGLHKDVRYSAIVAASQKMTSV